MPYPISRTINLDKIFNENFEIKFYSKITTFVGPNGSGKTQVLNKLKSLLKDECGKTRYLSSNRIGTLELYRSNTDESRIRSSSRMNIGSEETKQHRHEIEVAKGDFFTMDARDDIRIKVSERLSTLFNRNIYLKWVSGNLRVFFQKNNDSEEYSIALEASGLINLVSVLAALYDDEIKVLLIDEPEASLHPQLQSFLLNEIKEVSGDYDEEGKKMIIMATHSIEMIDIHSTNDLPNFIFFMDNGESPKQINPSAGELEDRKLKELVGRLGQTQKTAFYAKQPLLVEGVSDSLICNYFDDRFKLYLGVAGTQIVSVGGKGQFPATVKLMRLIGKSPIILADLDALIDNNDVVNLFNEEKKAIALARKKCGSNFIELSTRVKSKFADYFTRYNESVKTKYQLNPYWKNRARSDDEEKSRKRALLSTVLSSQEQEINSWENGDKWIEIRQLFESLCDCLEKAGCFILRKGTIESYYLYANNETSKGKPSAALEEIENLDAEKDKNIKSQYRDIYKALIYGARTKKINESDAIKRELLSEIAAIMHILNNNTTPSNIKNTVQQARGKKESLFEYRLTRVNRVPAVTVLLQSKIINVKGFPFTIKKGENVNSVINEKIK